MTQASWGPSSLGQIREAPGRDAVATLNALSTIRNSYQLSLLSSLTLAFITGLANTSYINLKAKDDAKVL